MEQEEKDAILCAAALWLPADNVLTEAQMNAILDLVIARVGDSPSEGEVFCKFLKAVAEANLAKATVDSAPISSERIDKHAVSYNSNLVQNAWKNFKKSLTTICPMYGYTPPATIGMLISSGEDFEILSCCNNTDLQL